MWLEAAEDQNLSAALLLDLSAAFDVIPHKLLFKKLESYKFSEDTILFFKSYLTNRKQRVVIDGVYSNEVSSKAGVPQGSRLGPCTFHYIHK